MLAKTGVTKAGYLLKQRSPSLKNNQWTSYFVVLNDHCLSYCSKSHNFERPDGNLLLTSGTRVYPLDGDVVIRIETGVEVTLLKGKDELETKEWTRAIRSNVSRLTELARGQVRVKSRGRVREYFLMLHRECITVHPSFSETVKILKTYRLTETSSFDFKCESIEFKTGVKGANNLTIRANNEVEHQHWCYALDIAVSRLRKDAIKTIVPPPDKPLFSGYLLCLDGWMKWRKKYVVLTEDSLYINEHRRVGFGTPPLRYSLVPNGMIFKTYLKAYSFELVLFSDSLHLSARDDTARDEWIYFLQKILPQTSYDQSDALQVASLEKEVEVFDVQFHSESSPGILLERRGNWAIAALVSESLSRKVCRGSLLSRIAGEPAMMMGFDEVIKALSNWKPPLQLTFYLSPRKMGWLTLMVKERVGRRLIAGERSSKVSWEKVYATLSSGVMTLFTFKRDGKSTKRHFGLYGSAIGIVDSNLVNGSKNCFRVLDGVESIILQAESQDSQMEWSTAIAHSISMENGGGILLDKEKRAMARDGSGLDNFGFPTPGSAHVTSCIFRGFENDETTSIVFAKPAKELRLGLTESCDISRLEPITEKRRLSKLDTTNITEATEEIGIALRTSNSSDKSFPVQALRTEAHPHLDLPNPWLVIDRVSSASSASDIFDKVSEFDKTTQINSEDYNKLVDFTKEVRIAETPKWLTEVISNVFPPRHNGQDFSNIGK
ncbi:hypothetical protein ACHAW5_003578 [Stephanodiscus triporus]|uniref:PH domain-containing protein n=1 Tax=Stephanodiscus triporus TaxID=2934178 RepID=A0ABD3PJ95_9STRA